MSRPLPASPHRLLLPGAAILAAAALILTGCNGGSGTGPSASSNGPGASGPATGTSEPTATGSTPTGTPTTGQDGTEAADTGAVDELRGGIWSVGGAGEVEFSVTNGALALVDVRPADGWQQRVADERADEIEVHFTRDAQDWKFEVEVDRGTLEISKELKDTAAAAGTVRVGSAATVHYTNDAGRLSLGDVSPADGWTITKRDTSSTEIELDFSNGSGGTAEFEADLEGSALHVEIDQKLSGPLPG